MKFDFEGQPEPIVLNAIYADGTKQTKHIELTNFLCGNLIWDGLHEIQRLSRSFTWILRNNQAFDSAYIACFEGGIKKASAEVVWVICLDRLQQQGQDTEEIVLAEKRIAVQNDAAYGESDSEEEIFEPGSCKLCKAGKQPVLRLCKRSNKKRYIHQTKHAVFHVKERKAQNLTRPVKF